ncbi:MAG: 1,4-alpha-glucan branching protein GlgB [Planctomycetes bacterium]|nr:1,4-alpha-glucan branching protein GlgB [Planctomycetota bacterium]
MQSEADSGTAGLLNQPVVSASVADRKTRSHFTRRLHRSLLKGMRHSMYRTLGAHLDRLDGNDGVRFAVWAPNARAVSMIWDGNGWTAGNDDLWGSDDGVWSGFVPGMKAGDAYKFAIRTQTGEILEKADPYAFQTELPPQTASIVNDPAGHEWNDSAWMEQRQIVNWLERPISIYEVHLASWKRPRDGRRYFNYRELATMLVEYVHEMGFTHLQLMPMTEYPFDGSWGYQTTGYFAPTSRFGTPDDFRAFVDHCHQADVGVLIDWVPAHFPTDPHALGQFDGTALYEHADPRQGFHPDWDTFIFNYGRQEVQEFLLSSARYWIETFHLDGLRVDAVASMLYLDYSREKGQWIPNKFGGNENLEAIQFLKDLNVHLHGEFPGILTIAEESTAWEGVSQPVHNGGLGFSMKWDMGWMNDTLHYMRKDPVHRSHHQNKLSFRMVYAFTENFILPLSHDEVVHGKRSLLSQMPGDYWQQFANLRLLYGYQFTMPGKNLLFMGAEFGQWTEWNHDEEIDWTLFGYEKHDGLRRYLGDLNRVYRETPALYQCDFDARGFRWIQADDSDNCVFAYLRLANNEENFVLVVGNFTPVPREDYRVGVPVAGFYAEILNSDAEIYGGSNLGNTGGRYTEPESRHGFRQSLSLTLPPLALLILKPVQG